MQFIEDFLDDHDARLIVAEDETGLFVLMRYGDEAAQHVRRALNERPAVRWQHHFQKETTAKAAADAFFEELRQRGIQLPESCRYLTTEV